MFLDSYLPNYLIREVHHFAVKTMPAETYRHMCGFDMATISWIRLYFKLEPF